MKTNRITKHLLAIGLLALACLFGALASVAAMAADAAPAVADNPKVEDLLKAEELPYVTLKSGDIKVAFTYNDETNTIYLRNVAVSDLPEDQAVYVYMHVYTVPDGPTPVALLDLLAKENGSLWVGKFGLDGPDLYYCSSFWLRKADGYTLSLEMEMAVDTSNDEIDAIIAAATGTEAPAATVAPSTAGQ
jgi:hypothetical protein